MKSNLEKIILLIAFLLFAACIYFAMQNFNKQAQRLDSIGGKEAVFESTPAQLAQQTRENLTKEHAWESPRIYNDTAKLNLFTSRPLLVPVSDPNPLDPVVIDDPQSKPLHAPIPNSWWLENNLPYIYVDSPLRDPDGDGFTNLEEFNANTSPIDPTERPDVIQKIALEKIESSAESYNFNAFSGGRAIIRGGNKDESGNFRREWSINVAEVGERFGPRDNPQRFELLAVNQENIQFRDYDKQEDSRNGVVTAPFGEIHDVLDYSASFRFSLYSKKGSQASASEGGEFSFPDLPEISFRLVSIDVDNSTALLEQLDAEGEVNRSFAVGKEGVK